MTTIYVVPSTVEGAINAATKEGFDQIEKIVKEASEEAALRIQFESFGDETGEAGQLPLEIRSGHAFSSIASEVTRTSDFHVHADVGALRATPEVEQYLVVQEEGATIFPTSSDKLAFPPGDAGEPIRDITGTQLFWASEFLPMSEEYGYDVWFTDDAIVGKQEGGQPELLFVLREFVEIPARRPIGRQEKPLIDSIKDRIQKALG